MPDDLLVDQLLQRPHGVLRTDLDLLDDGDMARLHRVALTAGDRPTRLRALELVLGCDALAGANLAREILALRPDELVRASTLASIARFGTPGAERTLLEALQTDDDRLVRLKAAAGLARVGSAESLGPLAEVAASDDQWLARQAGFALVVVAFRAGTADYDPRPVDRAGLLPGPAIGDAGVVPIEVGHASVSNVLDGLAGDTFGLTLDPGRAVPNMFCAGREYALLLDESVFADSPASLATRRSVPAMMAERAPTGGSWAVRWVAVSWPADQDKVNIQLHETSGQVAYVGTGIPTADGNLRIELAAARRPGGAPVVLTLLVSSDGVVIEQAASAAKTEPALIPEPLEFGA